jgi:hypothetical protein
MKNVLTELIKLSFPDPPQTETETPPAESPAITIKLEKLPIDPEYTQTEIDMQTDLKQQYKAIAAAINQELSDLETEYNGPNTSEKRKAAINKRRLTLLSKRAGTTAKIYGIERKIEQLYNDLNN